MIPTKITDITLGSLQDSKITNLCLKELIDEYLILIFYPSDFTFVCPTEINAFSDLKEKFTTLNTNIVFISCDSAYSHKAWSQVSRDNNGIEGVAWPMMADYNKCLVTQLGLKNDNGVAKRGTVIIDKEMNIKYYSVNDDRIGRSTKETLRVIRALKFNKESSEMCFVDWDD